MKGADATAKELKAEIERGEADISALYKRQMTDSQIKRLEEELRKRRREIEAEIEPQIERIRARLADAKAQIIERKEKKVLPISQRLAEFLRRIQAGVDFSGKFSLRWESPDGRFVIITKGPGTFWKDMLCGHAYAEVWHRLIDLDSIPKAETEKQSISVGLSLLYGSSLECYEGGRLTRERKALMIEKAEKASGQNYTNPKTKKKNEVLR